MTRKSKVTWLILLTAAISVIYFLIGRADPPIPVNLVHKPDNSENISQRSSTETEVVTNNPFQVVSSENQDTLPQFEISNNTPWNLSQDRFSKFETITRIAQLMNVEIYDISEIAIDKDSLDSISVGDVVPLELPGVSDDYRLAVTTIENTESSRIISGHVDGLDIGFGITLAYGEDAIFGNIVTPEMTYQVETIYGITIVATNLRDIESNDLIESL